MKNNVLKSLIEEMQAYPLATRIAAALHQEGVTSEYLISWFGDSFWNMTDNIPRNQIVKALQDIESGKTKIDKRLRVLARQAANIGKNQEGMIATALRSYADRVVRPESAEYIRDLATNFEYEH